MGRHAGPAPADRPAPDATGRLRRLLPRIVLAVTAAATTTLVVAWAGASWPAALLVGAGAGAVVLGAAWLAATVPSPTATRSRDEPPDRRPPHAVQ